MSARFKGIKEPFNNHILGKTDSFVFAENAMNWQGDSK